MENKLLCKVVMLLTKNESRIFKRGDTLEVVWNGRMIAYDPPGWLTQALYLVSDREIKEGDFILHRADYKNNWQLDRYYHKEPTKTTDWRKKIEATTDPSLGLPLIPTSFVEEYVQKQGNVDKVYIRVDFDGVEILNFTGKEKIEDGEVIILPVKESWNREEIKAILLAYENACDIQKVPNGIDEWFDKNY